MKTKWLISGFIVSLLIHLVVFLALGRIDFSLSTEFIDAYLLQTKKITQQSKIKKPIEPTIKTEDKNPEKKNRENSETERLSNGSEIDSSQDTSISSNPSADNRYSENSNNTNIFTNFINERMKFDIYWMGLSVGSASVSVVGDQNTVIIVSTVNSSEFISNFYYVNDRAESKIVDGKPKHFTLIQIEGRHRGNKETIFDYEKGEITFINHIKNKITYHKGINKVFMDVLSGFFYLRTMPIRLNDTLTVDIFDSDKFVTVQVQPLREETIELPNKQQVKTIVIKPQLDTEGLFKRKGDIIVWLTNDEKKIPVRIETNVPIGKVVAELREYKR